MRYVRCSKCFRLFCCVKHRIKHEHSSHVVSPTVPLARLKRHFRSNTSACPLTNISNVVGSANCRKRLFSKVFETTQPPAAVSNVRSTAGETLTKQSNEMKTRRILKAYPKSNRLSIKKLCSVAESCPAVPQLPSQETASATMSPLPSQDTVSVVETGTPLPTPPKTTADLEMGPQPLQHKVDKSIGLDKCSLSSFYETPMQTLSDIFITSDLVTSLKSTPPAVTSINLTPSAVTSTTPSAVDSPLSSTVDAVTPSAPTLTDVPVCGSVNQVSVDPNMAHCQRKGCINL